VPGIGVWTDVFVAVAVVAAALSVLSTTVLTTALASAVLHDQGRHTVRRLLWKGACLFASLLPTSIVVLILAVFVRATIAGDDLPAGGAGLIVAVAVGVVGNHIDRQVSTGWAFYWEKVHDSLRAAMPVVLRTSALLPACQRTRYNVTHRLLLDRDGREPALAGVLAADPCTRARPCPGHGGPTPTPPAPRKEAMPQQAPVD
jgi:hypothetical protein